MTVIHHETEFAESEHTMPVTSRFPRSTRDNCLRHPDPMQGPYRRHVLRESIIWAALCLLSFAVIGVLLAIRG
jgi:hypothetical protein